MTPDKVIEWQRLAGAHADAQHYENHEHWWAHFCAKLAQLARADMQEQCAKVCEAIADEYQRTEGRKYPELKSDAETGASACEAAIRALQV